ncbi:MAG: 3-deoxy-7-phosphoheptulonate synthase [Bacillota bacterium]|uniref:3-deoxy-D-arabinoheptulosonate-7-phosphate synthase n=2 Tax=Carboxydocella TaxID=178898 RepID=A0A1T4RTQ2_9FIRM|nr:MULTISPECIES: 3-deoxy-7-phosphoheptulonate synthase [Carboxydocella]AVX20398.1 3-deoxy-D-arabinoheptulosonate-7-phosphate synthase [Carboxydocella thermautotrophica]AVX30821.1 3-deoxy-D-arabinoheptulosonate-7-phosphate synthase [Carboxydocella thermautotrophica]SKA19256.1 3-deoxy-D-arabinoheptulosonate-7-phosphate synthase [Carboxydocella sporoproducens DSM 16521]
MIVVLTAQAGEQEKNQVIEMIERAGLRVHLSQGIERTILGIIGDRELAASLALEALPQVERVVPILRPYKLASRDFHPQDTVVTVGDVQIGGGKVQIIAGPCAVEGEEQILTAARLAKAAGASILRGGAYKPRTSPYSFQGMEEEGLKLLARARAETGLPVATEVVDPRSLELVAEYADILQIGARNMQNFLLLKEVARAGKPVILKRGMSATVEEWLLAAEYILSAGNFQVILCERGIRTFETSTRNTLDLNAVALARQLSHLPILVDPSHGTGKWKLVTPMALAGLAAGADGLMIEMHPNPSEAVSDGPQSLTPENFAHLVEQVRKLAIALGKELG